MKPLKYILIFFGAVFALMQFFRPEANSGQLYGPYSFKNEESITEKFDSILSRACYDCHSDSTKYPGYSMISPISWYIDSHVKNGKTSLNFSNWSSLSDSLKVVKLQKSVDYLQRRWMPLHDYVGKHPEAFLTDDEIKYCVESLLEISDKYQQNF